MESTTVRRRRSQRSRSTRSSTTPTLYSRRSSVDFRVRRDQDSPFDFSELDNLERRPSYYSSSNVGASTSTLVNPPPPLSLIFDRNSVINAILFNRSTPAYRIKTNRSVTKTSILDLEGGQVVAVWKRRDFFPDVVKFAHRKKTMRMGKWLKRFKHPGQTPTADVFTPSGRFCWRSSEAHRLAMFTEDDPSVPVAHHRMLHDPDTIGLVIRQGPSRSIQIEIIMSFIVMEHKLRMKEKRERLNGGGFFMMVT